MAHKSCYKIESAHSDTNVFIVDTGKNRILMFRDQLRMSRYYFNHCKEGDILDYSVGRSVSAWDLEIITPTILVCILKECSKL